MTFRLSLAVTAICATAVAGSDLPLVNLGYSIHQGSFQDEAHGLFNFSNIRYAEPPVGELRFAKPVAPRGKNGTVDKGDVGRVCPQAMAAWEVMGNQNAEEMAQGIVPELTPEQLKQFENPSDLGLPVDPRETEDCLFLDVVTPVATFNQSSAGKSLAPVIFWLPGGGYTAGDKTWENPTGLINASYASSPEGLVFVAPNNRLGALGWIGGTKLDSDSMTANAALYDQRLALEWVQKNIHRFGGDPNRVTIMGTSAGGASIVHHLTASGGTEKPLFKRAIPQSAGWVAVGDSKTQDGVVDKFLSLANVSSLDEARQLPTSELLEANRLLISDSAYGTSTTGPVVDGVLVPKFPDQLLAEGRFQHDIDILIGYNNNEGLVFTSPAVTNDSEFRYFLETTYSNAEPEILDHIENDLYPSVFNGSFGYTNQTQRAALTKSESEFICRYGFIQAAYGDRAKSYHFSIVPSLHGFDLPYVFYNALEGKTDVDASTAIIFQQLLTSFAAHGVATSPHLQTPVPAYGQDRLMLSVNGTGFPVIKDPSFQNRCEFWQKGSYL